MTLPAWLINELEKERIEKEERANQQYEQLRLPLYYEEDLPKEDTRKPAEPVTIQL